MPEVPRVVPWVPNWMHCIDQMTFSGIKKRPTQLAAGLVYSVLIAFRKSVKTCELLIISFRMCLTGLWRELLDKPTGRSKRKHLDFNAPSWLLITLVSNFNWLTVEDFFHHPLHVTAICLIKYLLPLKDYKILTSLIIWVHVVGNSGTNFRF